MGVAAGAAEPAPGAIARMKRRVCIAKTTLYRLPKVADTG